MFFFFWPSRASRPLTSLRPDFSTSDSVFESETLADTITFVPEGLRISCPIFHDGHSGRVRSSFTGTVLRGKNSYSGWPPVLLAPQAPLFPKNPPGPPSPANLRAKDNRSKALSRQTRH